jgi:hypothetical protein
VLLPVPVSCQVKTDAAWQITCPFMNLFVVLASCSYLGHPKRMFSCLQWWLKQFWDGGSLGPPNRRLGIVLIIFPPAAHDRARMTARGEVHSVTKVLRLLRRRVSGSEVRKSRFRDVRWRILAPGLLAI